MSADTTPVLDPRQAADVLAELVQHRPAYLPEWRAASAGAADALLRIVARYAQVVIDRLNQAPDRHLLAFLDMLGIGLIPAQPARAPIIFKTVATAADGHAEAGARVGAKVAGTPSPVVFETESAIALAGARLTDVLTVWPDRDAYADHTSEATGGRAFRLYHPLTPVPHVLYLAHDTVFAVTGDAKIEIEVELTTQGSAPLAIAWEFWDGQVWQPFAPFDPANPKGSRDGTAGFTRSGVVTLTVACGHPARTTVRGVEALWIRGRADEPLPPDPARVFPALDRLRVRAAVDQVTAKLPLDAAYAGPAKLDVTRTFHPLGQAPQPGSVFYFSNAEAFGKPGADITLSYTLASPAAGNALNPTVSSEYWNGQRWQALADVKADASFVSGDAGNKRFTMPADAAASEVSGVRAVWLRAHLTGGGYGTTHTVPVSADGKTTIDIVRLTPPALASFGVSYRWRSPWQPAQRCVTYNDFQFEEHSRDARWPGAPFPPFRPVADATPALYLGFDRPLPNDLVSLYLDLDESDSAAPPVVWEAWDGVAWRGVPATDDTEGLAHPGMASFIAPVVAPRPRASVRETRERRLVTASALEAAPFRPGQLVVLAQGDTRETATVAEVQERTLVLDTPPAGSYTGGTVTLAALPRFGTPRDWVRVRLKDNGAPVAARASGVYLNAVWALQTQTITGEVLGSGNGQPNQTLFFSQFPILPGEEIEVRELEGARAAVELPILRDELLAQGFGDDDLRVVVDPRTGKTREVWVRWRPRPHFYFSGPGDRHYVIERARGRLLFGDARNGRFATVGIDNVRARVYRAGGGLVGNVSRGAIDQLLGGAFAESVTNPRAATGGADGESPDAVSRRGPQTLRHRWRALAARDYEAMAREASPGVAAVRVLPATAANGRPAPGWVTVIVVPQSHDAQPQPSLELRRQVHDYLATRAPCTLAAPHIAVIGPTYRPVGVAALVAPRVAGEAGVVAAAVKAALATFLHPLTGGPDGRGWDFGRDVYLSDVAAVAEAVAGVDYVAQLDLLLDDAPVGTRVPVPTDQIVVAGPLRIELLAREG